MEFDYAPYSFSKIDLFNHCPKSFKYKYIDKIKEESSDRKALYKGEIVHLLIENILLNKKIPTIKKLVSDYEEKLNEEEIRNCFNIVNKLYKTEKFKSIYSNPFEKNVESWFYLDNKLEPTDLKNNALIQGKIDFYILDISKSIGLIIDWKTGGKSIENLKKYPKDNDQLDLYSLWSIQKFNLKGVKSKFFFVEHDYIQEKITTELNIQKIKNYFLLNIKKIEDEKEFLGNISNLCSFCEYKNICTDFN